MKIEVGKIYRTRDGRKATVYQRDCAARHPFGGAIDGTIQSWDEWGFYLETFSEHPSDLVAKWENLAPDPLLKAAKIFDDIPQPSHKYADTRREEDLIIFHSEQATTVFRWLDPCEAGGSPPVLQQKFIVMTRQNAGDIPLKTIEWRVIPTVSG